MLKHGKNYRNVANLVDRTRNYTLESAIDLVKRMHYVRFDECVEIAFKLGVDPRKADQMVRGSVLLPNGIGRVPKILVFAKGEKALEAERAGADFIGAEELIGKIREGFLDFERTIATPDIMGQVGKIGKILGPRGLMPNPKAGTVTFEVAKAVEDIKRGKLEFKVDKEGNVHMPVGRSSFITNRLEENILAAYDAIVRAKPSSSKGVYIRTMHIAATMTPSVQVEVTSIRK